MLLYTCFNDREYNVEFLEQMTDCAMSLNLHIYKRYQQRNRTIND